ncbi:MAG: hypothetical protein Q4D29_02345 [Lachnospiraceae bacterium]|nr:hypothetical protein [Lachnospiraceae bacterium]
MKKRVLSIVSFIVIFALLFTLFQGMFKQKWEGRYMRTDDLKRLSDEDVDILAFGTSELWAGYDPIVTYHQQGITGYNLTTPFNSAITAYYQLCQALEYHTPKFVICDFVALFEDGLPSEDSNIENLFCETFDILENPKLKLKLLRDVCELDDTKTPTSWFFPLIRYHSMWNELSRDNFVLDYTVEPYRKGARLESTYYRSALYRNTPENWNYEEENTNLSDISVKYYDMFIDKCHENGITVIAVLPPMLYNQSELAARYNTQAEYFYSRGVYCLNYNTYEQTQRMDLDLERDFYDFLHLNTLGSIKFSKVLADDLRTYFDIPDRRNDENIAGVWDAAYEQFKMDMLNSQPTIRNTVEIAEQFGYDAIAQVASDRDDIYSGELAALNKEFGYGDELKTGYYLYYNGVDGSDKKIDYYEYNRELDDEIIETSMGTLTRAFNLDGEYKYHFAMNGKDLFSERKLYYQYEVVNPRFATKLLVVDKDLNVLSMSSWEYNNANGSSNLVRRFE